MKSEYKNHTVKSWLNCWHDANSPRWSQVTRRAYRSLIQHHIVPEIGHIRLSALTEKDLQALYVELSENDMNVRTLWCIHAMLRTSLEHACCSGYIRKNPAAEFNILVPDETQSVMRLKKTQIDAYLSEAEKRNVVAIVHLGLTSEFRQADLFEMQWSNLHPEDLEIEYGKRRCAISEKTRELLIAERQRHPQSPYLFLNPKTEKPYKLHEFYYLHRRIAESAKLPNISFSSLKKSYRRLGL